MIGASCAIANSGMIAWACSPPCVCTSSRSSCGPAAFAPGTSATARTSSDRSRALSLVDQSRRRTRRRHRGRVLRCAMGALSLARSCERRRHQRHVAHTRDGARTRYSPGLVTAALIYVPLISWAFVHFVRCRWVAPERRAHRTGVRRRILDPVGGTQAAEEPYRAAVRKTEYLSTKITRIFALEPPPGW